MAKYEITSPDGRKFEITAPEGATQDEVLKYAQSQFDKPEQPSKAKAYLESLPPDRRKGAEAYMKGQGNKEAMRQEVEQAGPAWMIPVQFANNLLATARGVKQLVPGLDDSMLGAKGKEWDSLRAAGREEHPISSLVGDLGAEAAKMYTLAKAIPGMSGYAASNPYKFNTAYGTLSGAIEAGSPQERLERALWGGAGGFGGTALVHGGQKTVSTGWEGLKKLGRSLRNAMTETGPTKAAAKVAAEAAMRGVDPKSVTGARTGAQNIEDVAQALERGKTGATAGQAATPTGAAEFVALEDIARGTKPSNFVAIDDAQEAARKAALQRITPNEAANIASREAATSPLYREAATAEIPITGKLREIFTRMPKETLKHAAEIARIEGKPFQFADATDFLESGKVTPKVTGETMHYIKRALSDISSGKVPTTGGGQDYQRAITGLLNDFNKIYGGAGDVGAAANPLYGEARRRFAEMSVPVNQSKVLQAMQTELAKPGGGERVGPFLNVLGKGEEALLKRSTGTPRYTDIKDILSPQQMSVVKDVAGELTDDVSKQTLSKAGASEARRIANTTIGSESGPEVAGVLWRPATIYNAMVRRMEGIGGEKANKELARLFLPENKMELAKLIRTMKPNERSRAIAEAAKLGTKFAGGELGYILGKQVPEEE